MKLTALQIDRFGARSNLQLDDLSARLNVVYGPNGSGKSTIIHFIRWMLYGSHDEATGRYLSASDTRLGGSLRLVDGHQHPREVRRFWDSLRGDQVQIVPDDFPGHRAWDARRLTEVSAEEYVHIYCFGFDQAPSIERLLELARTRDAAIAFDWQQVQRLNELTARCDGLRREAQLAPTYESLGALHDQRRQRQDELQLAQRRHEDRLRETQQEADNLAREIAADRQHGESLQGMLRRTEAAIDARREQLQRLSYQADQTRKRWLDERRQEMAEIDYQIQQWHSVLDSVRHRLEELIARTAHREPQAALSTPADESDLRLFLRSLSYQMEDLEQDFRDWPVTQEGPDDRDHGDYLRSVLGAALSSMRADVHRLCRELQRQQANSLYHDQAREQDHLRRCETELQQLIESLTQRRDALGVAPEYIDQPWVGVANGTPSVNGSAAVRPSFEDALPGPRPSSWTGAAQPITDPVLEARLAHLIRRRDHLAARIAELATRIEQNERRLSHLRSGPLRADELRQLEAIRMSLEDLDCRIAEAESAERRRQEIESLEREIAQLRAGSGPSDVVREATSLLQRLTDGAYAGIRITPRHELWVDDRRGHAQAYRELSRGTRDHVYLSLALALVSSYRRRGVELPMIVNDVFANIDAHRAQATAELLAQFAAQGHQIILLTRHEHAMQRFAALPAKLYTLRERQPVDIGLRPLPAWHEAPSRSEPYYLDHAPPIDAPAAWNPPAVVTPTEPLRRQRAADWVAHWEPPRRPAGALRPDNETLTETARLSLAENSPLSDVEWLDRLHVTRLAEIDIRSVEQLIEADADECQRQLRDATVTAATVCRWQSQLALQCFVGLSSNDAALLLACGVEDPEELSYVDASLLHRRIEDFLAHPESRQLYGSIARYERPRLARWIQAARRSHFRRPRAAGAPVRRRPHRTPPPIIYRTDTTERLTPRARRIEPPRTKGAESAEGDAQADNGNSPAETLRFFLEPTDPIVDAPSIGPKTAERFQAIGVTTVAELLELDAADAARRINYRRITPELVRTWQLQTNMVSRVPNLRGHDAQLLVACEVPGPEQLAKLDPDTLVAQINALLDTADGKRILRGAKTPDRNEISAWIRWAQNARQLQLH